jgi:hypothetical protein
MASAFARPHRLRLLLVGIFERCAYRNHPHTTEQLKFAIQAEIAVINQGQDLLR